MIRKYQHSAMEVAIHGVTKDTKQWLRAEIEALLEQNIHFTQKADILAYGILGIEDKVNYVDEQIKELQGYKKALKESVTIAKELGAEVFNYYGISRLDGSLISSLTINKGISSSKLNIDILDEEALIDAGYYIKVLDEKRVFNEYMNGDVEQVQLLKEYCAFRTITKDIPSKLKINKRKQSNNTDQSIDIPDIDAA